MRSVICSMFVILFIVPIAVAESKQKSIEDLETEEFLLNGSLWERVEREARRIEIECRRAFPHEQFCECLSSEIPMVFTIPQYAAIVTTSRTEIGYDKMSEEEKKAIDVTIQAREKCAKETL